MTTFNEPWMIEGANQIQQHVLNIHMQNEENQELVVLGWLKGTEINDTWEIAQK